jgi:hypothetical protein
MSIQPPRGHLPAYIAPLYVLARALHDGFPTKGLPKVDLRPFSNGLFQPLSASGTYRGEHRWFDVKVSGLRPSQVGVEVLLELVLRPRRQRKAPPRSLQALPHAAPPPPVVAAPPPPAVAEGEHHDQPTEQPGQIELTPEELEIAMEIALEVATEAEAEEDAKKKAAAEEARPKEAAMMLVPPYETCLLSEHLSATARWRGMAGIPRTGHGGHTFPADADLRAPAIAAALVAEFRNVLADGGGQAVLIERTGKKTPVPDYFWTSAAAKSALTAEGDVVVEFDDDHQISGSIWFDVVALDAAWRRIRGIEATKEKRVPPVKLRTEPLMAVPQPTPWMIFMQEVALEFGYSGGKPTGKYELTRDQLAGFLRTRWPDELGAWSTPYAEALAAFILHPSNRKLGEAKATTAVDNEIAREERAAKKGHSSFGVDGPS